MAYRSEGISNLYAILRDVTIPRKYALVVTVDHVQHGKMAIDRWVENIKDIFPDCKYQHITFTMPDLLWQVFKDNRDRLGDLFKCACKPLLKTAKKKRR